MCRFTPLSEYQKMSSAFLEAFGFSRTIPHFPLGFLLSLCYSCHCTSLWKHSKPKIFLNWFPGTRIWLSLSSKHCTDFWSGPNCCSLPKQLPVYELIWAGIHSQWQYACACHSLEAKFNSDNWSFCAAGLRARGCFCARIIY